MSLICDCCNKVSDWLQRINPPGEDGRFYCPACLDEHLVAIADLKRMSEDELNLVPYTIVKWVCSGKNCNGHTKVRDYGIGPEYWHPRKSIHWFSTLNKFWMCPKHWKFYRRLSKNFDHETICKKLFNFNKPKVKPLC